MARRPDLLVLDEPTSQLDPWGADEVLTALHRLNDDLGLDRACGTPARARGIVG
ncbi:MAG: hypothetical protein R2845_13880 [Thermomicrobiales bacterium]